MAIIEIIIILGILFLIILLLCKSKNNNEDNILKKIILGLVYFVIFFITYYFVIALISFIPLFFMSGNFGNGSDSGLWAYGIIFGMTLSPVLSIITTIKIMNKNKK